MTKLRRVLASAILVAAVVACLSTTGAAQTATDGSLANVSGGGSSARWDISAANAGGTLTITFPDGRSIRKKFRAGDSPQVTIGEKYFDSLPDGVYTYELQLASAPSDAAIKARGKDDDPENERAARKRPPVSGMTQSGSFAITNGSIVVAGAVEPERPSAKASASTVAPRPTASANVVQRIRNNHRAFFMPDQVIPDDLIVQGSACVGLDCVNGEVFGFDTIRMKENNTRLQFEDTSAAGFPLNNWQIRANSSAAGGASFLAFVDQGAAGNSETGTIVFEVDAGAPANSLRVSSNGKVGFRTATPVLDLHANTSDTPAIRLEQNNSGGFSAQTWDIAGNEANFFVRDVTGGSRLPFRIRPGAPTSSIDIAASGNVGLGTQSPSRKLHILDANSQVLVDRPANAAGNYALINFSTAGAAKFFFGLNADAGAGVDRLGFFDSAFSAVNPVMTFTGGNVGILTQAPTQALSVNGTAGKPGGGSWDVFSDERLKNIKGRFNLGLQAVMQLQPLRYTYRAGNPLAFDSKIEYVGFGARELGKVIPEAVSTNENGYLTVNNDPILWTMLNAIKEQQKQIEDLKAEVRTLKARARRQRK